MLRQSTLSALLSLVCFSAAPAVAQVAGDWQVYARTTQAGPLCVSLLGNETYYDIHLNQAGNVVYGSASYADTGAYIAAVSGTLNGNLLDLTLNDLMPGTPQSKVHVFSLTLSASGEVLTGVDNWAWSMGGFQSCGGQDAVTAARTNRRFCSADQPGTCPCGNELPLGSVGGCRNSQGTGAVLNESGFPTLSNNWGSYTLSVSGARPNQPALLLRGAAQMAIPFKDGRLCMGNPTQRLAVSFLDAAGTASFASLTPNPVLIPFQTVHHQVWYRDPGGSSPCGQGSNFSDALTVMWLP